MHFRFTLSAMLFGVCLASMLMPRLAHGTVLKGQINGDPTSAMSPDKKFTVSLTVTPVTELTAPTEAEQNLLAGINYKKWTFQYGGTPPKDGSFNILQYGAFALASGGGANFTALYDNGTQKAQTNYDWVQFAYPTNWGEFGSKPNVDSELPKIAPLYYARKKLPTLKTGNILFYVGSGSIWFNNKDYPEQDIQNPAGGGKVPKGGDLLFLDQPFCSYTCLKDDVASKDEFDTFLVTFTAPTRNAKGTVTFLDGFHWGVQITGGCAKPPGPAPVQAREQCVIPEPPALLLLAVGCVGIAMGVSGFRQGYASRHRRTSQRTRTVWNHHEDED